MGYNNLLSILEEEEALRTQFYDIRKVINKMKDKYVKHIHFKVNLYCKILKLPMMDLENLKNFYLRHDNVIVEYNKDPWVFCMPIDVVFNNDISHMLNYIERNRSLREIRTNFIRQTEEYREMMK